MSSSTGVPADSLLAGGHFVLRKPGSQHEFAFVHVPGWRPPGSGKEETFTGRFTWTCYTEPSARYAIPVLDTTAFRFHPASVAGLVVGAMGVFVFGLYLRRWAKERRAGGSGPPPQIAVSA